MNKNLIWIITCLSILLLTALITFNIGPEARRQQKGPYRIFPKDLAHWLGWAGFLALAASASYSAMKRGFPKSVKTWLLVHCIIGTISLILVFFHLINKVQDPRPGYFISFFTFLLMAVIVVGGMLGRYVKARPIRDYWRTLHIPLTIIFYFTLAFHILEKMNLLW
ncbi:MAG: hypothetical protein QXJ17_01045 [Nitrososphaeria archaeon]